MDESVGGCFEAVEFWLDQKLVKMVIFPGTVDINGCVIVHEVQRNKEWLNTAQINAVAFIIEGIIAGVVIVSHGDIIFLLLVVVVFEQIGDDY